MTTDYRTLNRLRSAARDVEAAEIAKASARKTLDREIVDAATIGLTHSAIASVVGLTRGRVTQIVLAAQADRNGERASASAGG